MRLQKGKGYGNPQLEFFMKQVLNEGVKKPYNIVRNVESLSEQFQAWQPVPASLVCKEVGRSDVSDSASCCCNSYKCPNSDRHVQLNSTKRAKGIAQWIEWDSVWEGPAVRKCSDAGFQKMMILVIARETIGDIRAALAKWPGSMTPAERTQWIVVIVYHINHFVDRSGAMSWQA